MSQRRKLPSIDPRFSMYSLRIDRSAIHQIGVFAAEEIPRGKKVIEYTGERLTIPQAIARFKRIWVPGGRRPIYLLRLNRRWFLDGVEKGSGAERVNHCCDPNLKRKKIRGRMWFFSRRRIHRGEDLTLDYLVSPKAPIVRCRCGSPNCRGTINRISG
jgi:SET domain-containing protein